jgi:toxin ParE1/3/4
MARITRTSRAKLDILEIWFFIAEDSLDAADRLVGQFDEALLMLATAPEAARRRPELGRGLRSFPVGSYLIIYRPISGGIEVIRVIHGARDIDRIFDG